MRISLAMAAAVFALLWTASMALWTAGAREPAQLAILGLAGAVAGLLWYWAMKRYLRWQGGRNRS